MVMVPYKYTFIYAYLRLGQRNVNLDCSGNVSLPLQALTQELYDICFPCTGT